jgi:tetratricopeptide (TPR) repeat protein
LAHQILVDKDQADATGGGGRTEDLFGSCSLLVAWLRPDLATNVLSGIWNRNVGSLRPELLERLAQAARRHGAPDLAVTILEQLATRTDELGIRATHMLAGTLRDRGQRGDRDRARVLYSKILEIDGISEEQRVRSACGMAENLSLQGQHEGGISLLRSALTTTKRPDLAGLVHHRLATIMYYHADDVPGLSHSEAAIGSLKGNYRGPLTARYLDTHARLLSRLDRTVEAIHFLMIAIEIKRALGDRRGLQMGLLLLSSLRDEAGLPDPVAPAMEALSLASQSNDDAGAYFSHKRLAVLFRRDRLRAQEHREAASKIEATLDQGG